MRIEDLFAQFASQLGTPAPPGVPTFGNATALPQPLPQPPQPLAPAVPSPPVPNPVPSGGDTSGGRSKLETDQRQLEMPADDN